jgi:hypothetical protein
VGGFAAHDPPPKTEQLVTSNEVRSLFKKEFEKLVFHGH